MQHARLEHLLTYGTDPGNAALSGITPKTAATSQASDTAAQTDVDEPELAADIEQVALDQITADGELAAIAARNPPVSTPHATRLAEMLGSLVGPAGFYVYSIGFWAAVFAALLGVWQSVPYLYADFYAIWKKAAPALLPWSSMPCQAACSARSTSPCRSSTPMASTRR